MIVNSVALQSIFKGFKTLFNEAFAGTKPTYEKVATVVPSSTKSEEYGWLGAFPRLRKWVGDRVIICAYGMFDESEITAHKPRLVYLVAQNNIARTGKDIPVQLT